ncbi:MAG: GHKL domain-containing protein [Ruminococcus sp.]|nr:GHKL domain-containing protein [Ruminococcus sp.]
MIYLLSVFLAVICICLIIHIEILRHEMRRTADELRRTRENSYNRRLTVTLVDKDFTALASEMNHCLDFQQQLKQKNEQTEQQLKCSISDIAHDLRTPLTVIKGSLQLMELEQDFSLKNREYLRICHEKTDCLKKMADDFFELAILESEQTLVNLSRINAVSLIMQFVADNESAISSSNLIPEIELPEKNVYIMADSQLVMRILENLLNNVLRYAHGKFLIRLEQSEEICLITFRNSVHGLQQFDVNKLFERTYRADKSRQNGGVGLGLYIVRLLAEKQGGTVSASLNNSELSLSVEFTAG